MLNLQKKYIIKVKMLKKEKNPQKKENMIKELDQLEQEINQKMKEATK